MCVFCFLFRGRTSICIILLIVRTSHSQISSRKHGFSHLTPFVSWAAGWETAFSHVTKSHKCEICRVWECLESEVGEIERKIWVEEEGDIYAVYQCTMGEELYVNIKNTTAFIPTYRCLSDKLTPTHNPPLLSHIGCLSSLHSVNGHLSVNSSTRLPFYTLNGCSYIQKRCWLYVVSASTNMKLSYD